MSVRYGARQVGFSTPAPGNTKRRHESPKRGDAQSAIMRASGGCLDFNLQCVIIQHPSKVFVPVGAHWDSLKKNGITHTNIDGKLRKITRAEYRKYKTIQAWVDGHGKNVRAINSLHKKGRRRGAANDYVMTWEQAIKFADRCDTVLTPELKDLAFTLTGVAKGMADACRKLDYPLWPMTLLKMKKAAEKCAAFRSQGYQFCLIFGKFRSQARGPNKIAKWPHKPTQIWGPRSAKQWLRS